MFSIYRILNAKNGKSYIGYTGQEITSYTEGHFTRALRGDCPWKVFYNAIRKYGREVFSVSILYTSESKVEAQILEKQAISEHRTLLAQNGYNMTSGGDGGDTSASPRYRKGMRNRKTASGANHPNWGGFSDQHRKNLSDAKKGKAPPNVEQFTKASLGKICIHNVALQKETRIKPEQLEEYQAQGFVKGRLPVQCKVCLKWTSIGNMGRHHKHL